MRNTTKVVKALLALRSGLDERVLTKSNVIGSMVGLKLKAGILTKQLGITYFVREKILKSELSPNQHVPKRLRMGEITVTTDVVEWPRMIEQASSPQGTILFDGRNQGSLSCFGVSQVGTFGISCAHCLTGVDGNPATPTAVEAFTDPPGEFLPVGESVYLAYSPGTGVSGNFGYLDCGLFDLREPKLVRRASNGQRISTVNDIHALVGRHLMGISTLNAPNCDRPQRVAGVVGVEAQTLGERCDLVLNVQSPGTFMGDSGMLWLTEEGHAAAIHARGELMAGMQGSRLTTAMSAQRVTETLGVQLLLG